MEYEEIEKVINHLSRTVNKVGLEELWTCIDLHAKFPHDFQIPWGNPRGRVVQELKSALLRFYGRSCDVLAESIDRDDPCTAVTIAKQMQAGDTLISFNYDTVIERVVRNVSSVRLRHGKDLDPVEPSGFIRFAKPHGSASWDIIKLKHAWHRLVDGEPAMTSLDCGSVLAGEEDPLLLGAVPLKSELIFEVAERYGARQVFDVVREQWKTLANAIKTAERVVVLGYSFPKEDMYGRFFFREGMSRRKADLPLRVEFYSRSGDCRNIGEVFPAAESICFMGPVQPAQCNTTRR